MSNIWLATITLAAARIVDAGQALPVQHLDPRGTRPRPWGRLLGSDRHTLVGTHR